MIGSSVLLVWTNIFARSASAVIALQSLPVLSLGSARGRCHETSMSPSNFSLCTTVPPSLLLSLSTVGTVDLAKSHSIEILHM